MGDCGKGAGSCGKGARGVVVRVDGGLLEGCRGVVGKCRVLWEGQTCIVLRLHRILDNN